MHDEQDDMTSVVSHPPEFIKDAWYYFFEGGSGPDGYIKPVGPFPREAEAAEHQGEFMRSRGSAASDSR